MNKEEYEKIKARKYFRYKLEDFNRLLGWYWGEGWREIAHEAFKRSGLKSVWDDSDRFIQKVKEVVDERSDETN